MHNPPKYGRKPPMPRRSDLDNGGIRRDPVGQSGHGGDPKEFGMTGRSTMVDGLPVDSGSAKHFRKPAGYNQVGTKAKPEV